MATATKAGTAKKAAAKKTPARRPTATGVAHAENTAPATSSAKGLANGTVVQHTSGERYVVIGQGDPVDVNGDGELEPTYVLLPESSASHPQPASSLTPVK